MPQRAGDGVELLRTLDVQSTPYRLAWSPDGRTLAAPCHDRITRLWDTQTGELQKSIETRKLIYCVAWSPDGQQLVSASENGRLDFWDVSTGKHLRTFRPLADQTKSDSSRKKKQQQRSAATVQHKARCVAWSPDGKSIAVSNEPGVVLLRNAKTGNVSRVFTKTLGEIVELAWSPDGQHLCWGGLTTAVIWDIRTEKSFGIDLLSTPQFDIFSWSPPQPSAIPSQFVLPISPWSAGDLRRLRFNPVFNYDALSSSLQILADQAFTLICGVAWSPTGRILALGTLQGSIQIWDTQAQQLVGTLEAHTDKIVSVTFSSSGDVLASKSRDGTIRLWHTETWATLASFEDACATSTLGSELAFHPSEPLLASHSGGAASAVRIWRLDLAHLLRATARVKPVQYTTAKIVLVGESGVGKTGLGWRLAHDEYKDHESTHGQQFWVLHELAATRADGTECEAVLWDLAGQPDYRLIHALFLEDVDVALLLFDPANRQDPLKGVEYWVKQLSHGRESPPRMILIGSRLDRGAPTLTEKELEDFCQRHGISGRYVGTSARTGEGLTQLLERMKALVDWDSKAATVTTGTFKRIKEYVLSLKESTKRQNVLVSPEQLRGQLEKTDPTWRFSDAEIMTAVQHLSNHGYTTILRGRSGQPTFLLVPELLAQLASSFVNEARRNTKGLGSLEEEGVLRNDYKFPELANLAADEQEVLLDATLAMFLRRNLCFRETLGMQTFLVFPALINLKRPVLDEDVELIEDVAYTVKGAVENIYATLVVLLGYTNTFTRTNQWQNQAQYEALPGEICGFRQAEEHEGESEFVLYYGARTPSPARLLFQGLFESFLSRRQVAVSRIPPVACPKCRYKQQRREVVRRLRDQKLFLFCGECGEKIPLPKETEMVELDRTGQKNLLLEHRRTQHRTLFEAALVTVKSLVRTRHNKPASAFISYAWDRTEIMRWVEQLANDLLKAGVEIVLDRKDNAAPGENVARFISRIPTCDFVVAVGTPLYLKKYENKDASLGTVVAAEVDLIENDRLLGTEERKKTVIPLLLEGDKESSLPPLMQSRTRLDFRREELYFGSLFDLVLKLHSIRMDDPAVKDIRDSLQWSAEDAAALLTS
jgi:small GTP-binding protein